MLRTLPRWRVPPGWAPTPLARASLWLHGVGVPLLAVGLPWWPWLLGALAANHAVLAVGMHPRSQWAGRTLVRLPGPTSQVALTFDDGPDPAVTPRVLDLLDAHGARASFFCIGQRAAAHPALVREIARRGHRVENHTWSHPYGFAAMGPRAMRQEVRLAQAALTGLPGQRRAGCARRRGCEARCSTRCWPARACSMRRGPGGPMTPSAATPGGPRRG